MERFGLMSETRVPLVIAVLFLADIGLGIAYLANYMMGEPFRKLTELLALDSEASIATWYSSMQLFGIFALGGLYAQRNVSWKDKNSWALIGLPLLFLFLSMDEIVQIHEWLGFKSDALLPRGARRATFFRYTGIWMFVVGIPFLACFFLWAFSIRKYLANTPGSFRKITVGMMILLLGALGIEALSNFIPDLDSFGYVLTVLGEEIFEMVGGTVIFWGVYDLAGEFIISKESQSV